MTAITSAGHAPGTLARRVLAPFRVIETVLAQLAGAHEAAAEIERLSRMSDADLAARGVSRDDIARDAMARHMGL